jgi:error-prone DNA polymerase
MYLELHARSAFSFLEGASLPEDVITCCARLNMPAMALLDRDSLSGSPRFHLAAQKIGLKAHIGAELSCEFFSPQRHRARNIPKSEPAASQRAEGEKTFETGRPEHACEEKINTCHLSRSQGPAFSCSELGTESQFPISNRPSPIDSSHQQSTVDNRQSQIGPGPLKSQNPRLPLLAASRVGYQNLCRLITRMKLRAQKGEGAILEHELEPHATGLICLTGGDEGPLAAALKQGGPAEALNVVERLTQIFGRHNVYVELQRHLHREEEARNRVALEIARALQLPLLATNGVCYATPKERELCDALTAIRHHRTLMSAGRLLARNSERHLKSPTEMARLFADLPEALANTVELSSRLEFTLKDLGYEFPRYPVPEGETMMSFLRQRTDAGARWRYGISLSGTPVPGSGFHNRDLEQRARRQLERELALIEKLNLAGYFLIVWDLVRFCREQNILAQGRGSAANSAVCYALGITAVDPVGMELLFERFLSEERGEWPDIDIDLPSGEQRERVIQYVYQRYGQHGAAMTANVITYRNRLAAREMGKAMGFDPETLNKISAAVATWEFRDANDALDRRLGDAGLDLNHPRLRKYFELCLAVQDLPRHLGQHSGGMVICQGRLDSVVPLEPASMPGRVVVQWDKEDCADMGIIKVDLLGLGMMAVLEDSLQLIRKHYREEVDLAHLPADDPAVYSALQNADTIGLFQVESRAQMSCLPRLRPQCFYDIVVEVAIIRPGPIVGQMVNPYLKRRQGREPVTYPHPSLEPVLKRTLGVPLFQEQLLRIAMISANFTGGEAEELRRAMGFKRSQARMKEIEARLREGMTHNGLSPEAQEQIILSISSFALYGFPESHAASFALIAYASAWLKCHYLAAFTAALLNNQPMGFYHPATLVKDAQRHGLRILPIDVTKSDWLCTLEEAVSSPPPASSNFPPRSDSTGKPGMSVPSRQNAIVAPPSGDGIESQATVEIPWNEIGSYLRSRPTPANAEDSRGEIENRKLKTPALSPCLRSETPPALRLGLKYVRGLRETAAQALIRERSLAPFTSIHDLARRVPELRKDELSTLAEIGALNFVGNPTRNDRDQENKFPISHCQFHRRDALWQVESAVRHSGPLLEELPEPDSSSPLHRMTHEERLVADFHGTGLTVGPHPMSYRRTQMRQLGIRRASELKSIPSGERLRIGGCVITRQRPGTAKGFLFLSLEDETGIANAIVHPDLLEKNRLLLVSEPFLLVEGILQNQDNVISVKAERVSPLFITRAETTSHDFH